jgi:VWFA-related protein
VKHRTAFVVLVFVSGGSVLLAQTVREKVAVEVVTVRLTARTTFGGRRVEDLKASDLALKVDGQPVAIETFSAVASRSEDETTAGAGEPSAAAPATGDTEEPPLRTMIFVDEVETHPFDRKDVCAELVRYLRSFGRSDREFSVFRYDGILAMETPWTRDVETVVRVLSEIGAGGKAPMVAAQGMLSTETGSRGLPNVFAADLWVSMHRERFSVALMEALAAFPQTAGRKRLLVVNGGTSMMRPGDLAYVRGPSLVSETAIHDRSKSLSQARIDEEHDRESQRFSFDLWSRAVNPGLDVLSMNDVVAKALEEDVEIVPVYANAVDRSDVTAAAAMIGLATETGAESIGLGRNAAARMAEIEDRSAYELTFRDPVPDHDYHRIALECLRPFVRIVYRRGFRIPREEELTLDTVVAGLRDPGRLSNPMKVQVSQQPSTDAMRRPSTTLELAYAPPLETGASDVRPVSFVAVGEDRRGDRTEPVEWTGTAQREDGEDAFATDIRLNVSPEYAWSLAVRDQPTGLTSYVFVPAPSK